MATNKIHAAMLLLYHSYGGLQTPEDILKSSAIITTPDSMRCWVGSRAVTHFTENPESGEISGMVMPLEDVKLWDKSLLDYAYKSDAGKPGDAVIDENTVPAQFWRMNQYTPQNFLFFLHLIQDGSYDRFIRSVINVSKRYEDKYEFNGTAYSGADLRGKGMARWNDDGLLNQLDSQFYVRIAKRFFDRTGKKLNKEWLENEWKPAFYEVYSEELADRTVKFVSIHPKADAIITSADFNQECWAVPNWYVDQWIDWMMEDMKNVMMAFPYIV